MQLVILAGGKGTRLGLTDIPKPMCPVAGKPLLERQIELAVKAGAEGGKLLGAGGGGFMLFYVKEQNHQRVRNALSDLKEMPFKFDNKGTTLIHYNKHSLKGRF